MATNRTGSGARPAAARTGTGARGSRRVFSLHRPDGSWLLAYIGGGHENQTCREIDAGITLIRGC
eukprot:3402848-Lingulodinium_polyedra.AAC.1